MLDRFRSALMTMSAFVFVAGVALYAYVSMGGNPFGGDDGGSLTPTNFSALRYESPSKNAYALCAPSVCPMAIPDGDGVPAPVTMATLRARLASYIDSEPLTSLFNFDFTGNQFTLLERDAKGPTAAVVDIKLSENTTGLSDDVVINIYSYRPLDDSAIGEHEDRVLKLLRILGISLP